MKSKKILAAVLTSVFLSTTVLLAGCNAKKTETEKPVADKIDADQTINIVGYDYKSLDPSVCSDAESFTTHSNVYEGLVKEVEKNGVVGIELAGAEKITTNADKTVYTFKLRDTKWSDGKAVTAQDYVFAWTRLADPKTAADYMMFLDEIGVKNAKEFSEGKVGADQLGVKAVDDKTFEVTLKAPTAFFENACAFKALAPGREDLAKAQGDKYGTDFKTMAFNGPFVVADYQKGSKVVYKKNETYWNAKAIKLQTCNAHVIDEPATVVKMFESKELDMAGATGDDLAKLKKKAEAGEFKHITGYDPSVSYLYLNVEKSVLKNTKVRQALSLSVNKQQFLDVVFKRHYPAYGIVPQKMAVGTKDYRKEVAEPLKAVKEDPKKLMEEGLKELGITDPSKVELTILNGKQSSTSKALSEYFQKTFLDTFGIKLNIKYSVDNPTYFTERQKGNFDICSGGWGADYNDANSFFACFTSDSQNNNGKYNSPEYDKWVKDAAKESDSAKRVEMYKKAEEQILVKDAALIPTHYRDINNFRHNYLKGMYLPQFGGYFDLANVYVSGK